MTRYSEFKKVQSLKGKRVVPYAAGKAVNDFCSPLTTYFYTHEEDGTVRQFDSPDTHLTTEFIYEVDDGY